MIEEKRFQILSLDGGGIKGLFSAAVLAAIEEDLGINIVDHFDLITGTSTGGIIALALGLGMKPREIVEFYLNEGPKIFSNCGGLKHLQHWFFRKYSSNSLEKSLQRCFKDKKFGESKKRLVIPSYNLGENDIYLFRTPHDERLKRDYKVPMWKIALATSAAPTFFPCARQIDKLRLIDGGVWANNPTLVGIIEAFGTLRKPLESLSVFSIGTSDVVACNPKRLNLGGLIAWTRNNAATDIILRGQSIGVNNQAKFLLGQDKIERINPKVASDEFSLDGVHKTWDLIGKAAHHSRSFTPIFKEKFKPHKASHYESFYK